MRDLLKKNTFILITAVAGAAGGFLYWKYIGCISGTCPIKSVWYLSTLYGLGLGWIAGSLTSDLINSFKKRKKYE